MFFFKYALYGWRVLLCSKPGVNSAPELTRHLPAPRICISFMMNAAPLSVIFAEEVAPHNFLSPTFHYHPIAGQICAAPGQEVWADDLSRGRPVLEETYAQTHPRRCQVRAVGGAGAPRYWLITSPRKGAVQPQPGAR